LLCLPLAALADIHYVSLTGGNIPPYTTGRMRDEYQDAVNAAAPANVLVTNGTYLLAAQIVATNAIALESLNGRQQRC